MGKPESDGSKIVVAQRWEEIKEGKSKGHAFYTLHPTKDHCRAYCSNYKDKVSWESPIFPPTEYFNPADEPFSIEVSDEVFARVQRDAIVNGVESHGRLVVKD